MVIHLGDLLERVPPEVERQVKQIVPRLRPSIREALMAECGLSLPSGPGQATVTVNVEPGYPVVLGNVEFPDDYEILVSLARSRRLLEQIAQGAEGILCLRPEVLAWGTEAGDPDVRQCLEGSAGWARAVLKSLEKKDPLLWVLGFDEDILGVYQYDTQPHNDDDRRVNRASIHLYWMVIGLVSDMLGCSVEDLTEVVLVHELAHAYTQVGADTDGRRWLAREFFRTETEVKEGLAQYYTHRVLGHRKVRHAGAWGAYQALLGRQPAAYSVHLDWIAEFSPEVVRRAMVEVRCWQELSLSDLGMRLKRAQSELPCYPTNLDEPVE